MHGKTAKTLTITALVAMVAAVGLSQNAVAEYGSHTVWMSITNTKTDTVKQLKWDFTTYHFQKKILLKPNDFMVKKIAQIFGTDRFEFNTYVQSYEASWYHFNVVLGIDRQIGTNLHVVFAESNDSDEYFIQRNYKLIDFVRTDTEGDQALKSSSPPNPIKILVNSDKGLYTKDERAIIFITFLDDHDRFVDPDNISANLNIFPIDHMLEKKKVGSYTLVTPPLGRGDNKITIAAQKEMYNIEPSSINITVLPEIPVAWYQQ